MIELEHFGRVAGALADQAEKQVARINRQLLRRRRRQGRRRRRTLGFRRLGDEAWPDPRFKPGDHLAEVAELRRFGEEILDRLGDLLGEDVQRVAVIHAPQLSVELEGYDVLGPQDARL